MSFDWREYLQLSRFFQDGSTRYIPEAAYRCGISRAYYAAFCYARNFARDKEGLTGLEGNARDHPRVRNWFQNSRPLVFSYLDQLRQWRNDCDYEDELRGLSGLIPSAIEYAQEIIDELI
jgi:hypothetical protein